MLNSKRNVKAMAHPSVLCTFTTVLGEPSINLGTAQVIYRFNSHQVALRESITLTFVHDDYGGSALTNISPHTAKPITIRKTKSWALSKSTQVSPPP